MTENENAPPVMADGDSSVGGPEPAFSAPAFSALRHDANDLPWPQRPWIMAALCAVAGVIFYLLVDGGDQSPLRQAAGVFVAVLFAIEFLMLAQSLRFTSASHGVVLLYTAPIFVALGLHWKLPSERLSTLQWSGIFLAFLGIVATFVGRDSSGSAL